MLKLLSENRSRSDHSQLNRGVIFNTQMKLHLREVPLVKNSQVISYEQDGNEIICYLDIANKYGIGYLLSNGNLGIIFNDQTSLTQTNK